MANAAEAPCGIAATSTTTTARIATDAEADDICSLQRRANCLGRNPGRYRGVLASKAGMACYYGNHGNQQQTARSMHPGGVMSVCATAACDLFSDTIQTGLLNPDNASTTPTPAMLGVWDKLLLSHDGQPIDASTY